MGTPEDDGERGSFRPGSVWGPGALDEVDFFFTEVFLIAPGLAPNQRFSHLTRRPHVLHGKCFGTPRYPLRGAGGGGFGAGDLG